MKVALIIILVLVVIVAGCISDSKDDQTSDDELTNDEVEQNQPADIPEADPEPVVVLSPEEECLEWANSMVPDSFVMETFDSETWIYASHIEGQEKVPFNKWTNGEDFFPLLRMWNFEVGKEVGENINLYYPVSREYKNVYTTEQFISDEGVILGANTFSVNNMLLLADSATLFEPEFSAKSFMWFDVLEFTISGCNQIMPEEGTINSDINKRIAESSLV